MICTQFSTEIKKFQSNNGKEYDNSGLNPYLAFNDIRVVQKFNPPAKPDSPDLNFKQTDGFELLNDRIRVCESRIQLYSRG